MLLCNLVAEATLISLVLIVDAVELKLNHVEKGILGEYHIENVGGVVEGHTDSLDPALALHFVCKLICACRLVFGIIISALRVHKIDIKVLNAAALELCLEEPGKILCRLEEGGRELVGQNVGLSRISRGEAIAQNELAVATDIVLRGVKIVETCRKICVKHRGGALAVNLAVGAGGQTHTSKAEITLYLIVKAHLLFSLIPSTYFLIAAKDSSLM